MKKIFTREVKIGIMVIAGIWALVWGINFLKGINIFVPQNSFYTTFEHISSGLQRTSPVVMRGHQVGQVSNITYDFTQRETFMVTVTLNENVKIPQGYTTFVLTEGLLGAGSIEVVLDPAFFETADPTFHSPGDFVPSSVRAGMFGAVEESILPKLATMISQIDSTLLSIRSITESTELQGALSNLESTLYNLDGMTSNLNNFSQNTLPVIASNLDNLASNFVVISEELKEANIGNIVAFIDTTMMNIQLITDRMNSTEGTLGLLLNDSALYRNLSNTMESANLLLQDMRESPQRYVHFSIFGRRADR